MFTRKSAPAAGLTDPLCRLCAHEIGICSPWRSRRGQVPAMNSQPRWC